MNIEQRPWHALTAGEIIESTGSDIVSGLSNEEAHKRLTEYGPNAVTKVRRKSRIAMVGKQFLDPLVLVLVGSAVLTLAMRDFVDAGVIAAVVAINAVIGFIQEDRAESAIESLAKLLTFTATALRNGNPAKLKSEELVPGDVIILMGGDRVPADVRLLEIKNLHADESMLTGESAPVSKSIEPVGPNDSIPDRTCMAYSGTLITSGSAKAVVVATGDDTELGRISSLIEQSPDIATPLTRKLVIFSKWLSGIIIVLSAIIYGLGVLSGRDPMETFNAVIAMAVAVIPEGLPAIVTIVMAVGVKRMADRKAIIRTLPSVETLGSVTVICSDKTGTLTTNEMTVRRALAGEREFEFGGVGYNPNLCCVVPVDTNESELSSEPFIECLRCGLLCNDSNLEQDNIEWIPNGDPTEVALIVSALKSGLDPTEENNNYPRVDVVPFESSHMYMATLHDTPSGDRVIYLKGSLERVLEMCRDSLSINGISPLDKERITARAEGLTKQGLRLLGFARKIVPKNIDHITFADCHDLTYLGIQSIMDPPRPEVIKAIRECHEAGIDVKMITGDHINTARAIANELGIGGPYLRSITGEELSAVSPEQISETAHTTSVFARVAPDQKYRLVEALQSRGEVVAMTGDGVNDAPALKRADVGIAMGKMGSEVAKDASDMVLADDNFASIVAAVEEGRTVFSNLLKSLAYILPTNAGQGMIIVFALLSGFTLPVTPVQVLWINTITTVALALPLAFEKREPGIMQTRPRDPDSPLLPIAILLRMLFVAAYMVTAAFLIFNYEKNIGAGIDAARTAAVNTIVTVQVFYLFNARSERIPLWRLGLFGNPYIWTGIFLVALLQIAFTYSGIMNLFFSSSPLSGNVWLKILMVSFPISIVIGLEKQIRLLINERHRMRN